MSKLEDDLFVFLSHKYVQRQDDRQKKMGLIYTEAETHDLAFEVARFIKRRKLHQHFSITDNDS